MRMRIPSFLACTVLIAAVAACEQDPVEPESPRLDASPRMAVQPDSVQAPDSAQADTLPSEMSVFMHLTGSAPPADWRATFEALGARSTGASIFYPEVWGVFPREALPALKRLPWVASLEWAANNLTLQTEIVSWGFYEIEADLANALGYYGAGIKVAVLDDGIDCTHPDLEPRIQGGHNLVGNADNINYCQDGSHGTPVASVLAASVNDSGVRGVASRVDLYAVRVCGDSGCSWTDVREGIEWATARGMQVINMSFADCGEAPVPTGVQTALSDAWAAGITTVVAGGNGAYSLTGCSASDPPSSLAQADYTIGVAALDTDGTYADGYQYGTGIDLSAPHDVRSSDLGGGVGGPFRGTSYAAPHVAASAALLYDLGLTSPADIRDRLTRTAVDHGAWGWDEYYGHGVVNVGDAIYLRAYIEGPRSTQADVYCFWDGSATGGLAPYTYDWYRDGVFVHQGQTYEDWTGDQDFHLELKISDSSGQVRSTAINVEIDPEAGECGGGV